VSSEQVEVVEVQTVGELRRPTFHLSSTLLQATPLGHVPGRNAALCNRNRNMLKVGTGIVINYGSGTGTRYKIMYLISFI
jgi:hypothetical protein